MSTLTEILRPSRLEEIVGQTGIKKVVSSWIEKDSFPRCQLYLGPVGTGKSSLAQIVAHACQGKEDWEGADIRQINAGAVGKVDDARELASESSSIPFVGRYRVFILEEAHRMTDAAQDALLVPMEANLSTLWILTSSEPKNILPGIRSRCAPATFEFKPLNQQEMLELCERALVASNPPGDWNIDPIADWLYKHDIRQPREVLGILEQRFTGLPLEDCIHGSEHEPIYSEVSTSVLSGNWTKTSGLLKQIKTADYRAMVSVVSAKLSWALLDESIGPRGDAIATCLVGLGANQFADGVAYSSLKALLYKCCKALSYRESK